MSVLSSARVRRAALAIGICCAMATAAHAVPVTYSFSGLATGTIGSTLFTDAEFNITGFGDTANIVPLAAGVPCNDLSDVTFTISGIDSGYVTSRLSIAANTGRELLALTRGLCADGGPLWLSGYDAPIGAYNLATAIGPLSLASPSAQTAADPDTWSGVLSIHSITSLTFKATAGAAVVPVVGLWWNPSESGSGYNLDVKNGVLVVTIFSYAENGQPLWYITSGPIVDKSFSGTINKYAAGQCISCAYNGLPTSAGNDGVIGIDFSSPTSATLFLPGGRVTQIQPQAF